MEEKSAIDSLLKEGKALLDKQNKPEVYNIGINCRETEGQTNV